MKILLTDHAFDPSLLQQLVEEAGHTLIRAQCKTEADVIAMGEAADALLVEYAPVTAAVLDRLPRCRIVVRHGVGLDTVDLAAAAARGVYVANVPDYCVEEVSDHALALLLAAARKVVIHDRLVSAGRWDAMQERPLHRLQGRSLGLVGFGNIARRLGRKAAALGLQIHTYDPYASPALMQQEGALQHPSLESLLAASDYLSLHLPLTPETRGIINATRLRQMRSGAVLVNTARGLLVDSRALAEALTAGHLSGAALDVLDEEPPSADHPLLHDPRVILTPHIGYYSEEADVELKTKMVRQVLQVLDEQTAPTYWANRTGFVTA